MLEIVGIKRKNPGEVGRRGEKALIAAGSLCLGGGLGAAAAPTLFVTALFSPLRNTADTCRPTAGWRAFSTPLGGEDLAVINAQTLTRLTGENVYVP